MIKVTEQKYNDYTFGKENLNNIFKMLKNTN